ncbi:MAG: hypothetical protein L0191_00835 [Acidobacteria bacterium]|nr:hypothetical protein [Acidobacteriota bacterium]MCI0567275.1 hypothetical protein [Acidobacteriota bacterium]
MLFPESEGISWRWLAGVALAGELLLSGCASTPNPNVVSPYSTKLSTFNYKDEGTLVLIIVGVEAAQYNVKEKYFPLFVTLANKGAPTLHVTPESFTFEDSLGRKFSPVPLTVIQAEYHRGEFDRKLFRQNYSFTGTSVDRYTPIASNFYPSITRGVVNDNLQLPRFAYMNDLLYFPVPEQGVVGGPFRLYFKTPELEEAVVVSFEIGRAMSP